MTNKKTGKKSKSKRNRCKECRCKPCKCNKDIHCYQITCSTRSDKGKKTKKKPKGKSKSKKEKKMSAKKFKNFLLGKEKEYWKDMQDCQKPCPKKKTKNKQKKCYKSCEDKRLKKIRSIHKQYPKEFKQYISGL